MAEHPEQAHSIIETSDQRRTFLDRALPSPAELHS
jgi:hypothetical protein